MVRQKALFEGHGSGFSGAESRCGCPAGSPRRMITSHHARRLANLALEAHQRVTSPPSFPTSLGRKNKGASMSANPDPAASKQGRMEWTLRTRPRFRLSRLGSRLCWLLRQRVSAQCRRDVVPGHPARGRPRQKTMRQPRIERGAHRWQRWILPLNH